MVFKSRLHLVVIGFASFTALAAAQKSKEVTIREPGIYGLEDLFKQADTVALVKVVAGDMDSYDVPIYKAEVVESFKGAPAAKTIFFGPYVGEKLGWEYILFLRSSPKTLTPKATSNSSFGSIQYSEIFNEGYTSMETSYECVFDGKDIGQRCDYGVRVCTDYIKLSKSTPTFPPMSKEPPFGCRWVRKTAFISLLNALGSTKR